jgi:hypothetical protein
MLSDGQDAPGQKSAFPGVTPKNIPPQFLLGVRPYSRGPGELSGVRIEANVRWNALCGIWTIVRGLPAEGFEPPTYGLQNRCTTTVLSRRGWAAL